MKVIVSKPGKMPQKADIPATEEAVQSIIGGPIKQFQFKEDGAVLLYSDCSGEHNITIFDRSSQTSIPIEGACVLCGLSADSGQLVDLDDELAEEYIGLLQFPQIVV